MKDHIIELLCSMTGWNEEKASHWYYTPNPHFGGATPHQLVEANRSHKVIAFIEGCHQEMEEVARTVREALMRRTPCSAQWVRLPWPGSKMGKYYLQDSRSVVGNFLLFWAKGNRGYTTDIDNAQECTLEEALSQRDTDVPWPVEDMRAVAKLRVDHQNLMYTYKEQRQRMTRRALGQPEDVSLQTEPKERISE